MKQIRKKLITWIKNNSGRLLLYAVILTACFSIKNAAYGKYVDYVTDYTSVSAAPFYFSSNYLEPQEVERTYTIGSFDGESYELDVEIRNADNSYNFNKAGTDVYYYVTAELFSDEAMTEPVTNQNLYTTRIKYGANNANAAGMAKNVKIKPYKETYSEIEDGKTVEKTRWVKSKPIIIDSTVPESYTTTKKGENGEDVTVNVASTDSYNSSERYKLVGLLEGLSYQTVDGKDIANTKTNGKQSVKIEISWRTKQTDSLYLKVTAHTIPATTTVNAVPSGDPNDTNIYKIDPRKFVNGYPTDFFPSGYTAPAVKTGYEDMQGVYNVELQATFQLNGPKPGAVAGISKDFSGSNTEYTLLYTFTSTLDTKAKIYFDSSKMNPDDSLGTVYKDTGNSLGTYIILNLYANGSKSCYFYRKSLSTDVTAEDVQVVEIR